VEELPRKLNRSGYYTIGYADDTVILINRKFPSTVSKVLHTVLGLIQQSCNRTDLSINPRKMVVIPLTKKRALKGLMELILFGKTIQLSTEVK
jgi:hypothetical protein